MYYSSYSSADNKLAWPYAAREIASKVWAAAKRLPPTYSSRLFGFQISQRRRSVYWGRLRCHEQQSLVSVGEVFVTAAIDAVQTAKVAGTFGLA